MLTISNIIILNHFKSIKNQKHILPIKLNARCDNYCNKSCEIKKNKTYCLNYLQIITDCPHFGTDLNAHTLSLWLLIIWRQHKTALPLTIKIKGVMCFLGKDRDSFIKGPVVLKSCFSGRQSRINLLSEKQYNKFGIYFLFV